MFPLNGPTWPLAVAVFLLNIALAYTCLKLEDEPVRKFLMKRLLK